MKAVYQKYPLLDGYFSFSQLNQVQATCLPLIMDREDNLIVSAPTSSGKTVLFEIAILKYAHLGSPICLYLAPIKSLCREKFNHWQEKFGKRLTVAQVTGDTVENSQEKFFQAHITVGTPEKVDFLSRQSLDYLRKIKLLLIDEVHMLNFEERGATLEAIVSRVMSLNREVRIIAVSATIPNIRQVGEWLRVPKPCVCVFGQECRPVKIERVVLGFKLTGNPFTFEKSLNNKLLETIRMYSEGRGSLIFCPTQKGTELACQQISNAMKERQFVEDDKQLTLLVHAARQVSNSNLQVMIPQGLAFHNASLSPQDRGIVQRLFRDLRVKVLCTTSTLAMGINLPARLVVIKSTQTYKGSTRGYQEYSRIEIDQMMGRAGRPPFDSQGTVVIMTDHANVARYSGQINIQDLQSQLFSQILEHLNAEISLGSISSLDDVIEYIRNSFCYIRMKKSPLSYNITGNVDEYVEVSCRKAIDSLAKLGAINYNPESGRVFPRALSNSISRSAAQVRSIATVSKSRDEIRSEKDYLMALCRCEEICRYNSKVQERKILKEVNDMNKYPLKQAISTSEKKSFVLVQAELSRRHLQQWEMRRQVTDILTLLRRLNYCVRVLGSETKSFWLYYWAARFQKYFNDYFWEVAEEQIILQLPGLQDKGKFLALRGVKTLQDLKKNMGNIGNWMQKGPAFATQLSQIINCYEKTVEIGVEQQRDKTVLKVACGKLMGKMKGVHLCVGDAKDSLYFNKFLAQQSNETVVFPRGGGIFKIGLVKEGMIGFDEFYMLEKETLTKFDIDRIETKPVRERKSVENVRHRETSTALKEKKSKSHEVRKKFGEAITSNIKKKAQQRSNIKYSTQKEEEPLSNKEEKQLRLPPNYRVRQPIEPPSFVDDPMLRKQIKKEQVFKYKPLEQYNWKPGFEQFSQSQEDQKQPKKFLKVVQSKPKPSFPVPSAPPAPPSKSPLCSKGKGEDVFSYFLNLFCLQY